MDSILVTGGAGFIGSHLVDELRFGMAELVDWLATQTAVDRVDDVTSELLARGLAR